MTVTGNVMLLPIFGCLVVSSVSPVGYVLNIALAKGELKQ